MELKIDKLSKTYPNGIRALNEVSLKIGTGMFGLLGPNGAGKSTLMRTIATLQEPDEGTIFLDDIDVLNQKSEIRRILGYLPQEFGVYPKVSAEMMLDHLAVLKGVVKKNERKELVASILEKTNLYEARKKNLGGFSGGMKQRFGIAQALLADPKLIIVDEPTAGLDPEERNRFLNLLSELGEDIVVILSTHIVEDVKELCTDMAIIDQGEVVLKGNPEGAIKDLQGKVWQKPVDKDSIDAYKAEQFVISEKLIAGKPVLTVYSESSPGDGFEAKDPDVEDVYFSYIKEPERSPAQEGAEANDTE